jgi:phosphoglycerate-specific signal transduction histidine kinase
MTTYRSTNEEKQQRINFAADELAKGKRAMDISKKLAKKYNVSIQQARDYVRQAKPVLTESISPNDRAFIFSKVMNCLEQDRLDARDQENLKEQTRSTGGMVKMVSLLTTIDQVGCWDDAYNSHLFKNFSEAKKKLKHSDLDALDGDLPEGEIPF